jgi:hypothetical protein
VQYHANIASASSSKEKAYSSAHSISTFFTKHERYNREEAFASYLFDSLPIGSLDSGTVYSPS